MPPTPVGCDRHLHIDGTPTGHFVPWRFDSARNHALDCARYMGADWCLYVDTDMILSGHIPSDLGPPGVLAIECEGGGFASPLLIHTSTRGRWHGRNHEYFDVAPTCTLDGVSYRELPKSPEAMAIKLARGLEFLPLQMADDPDSIRWPMYYAQTLECLERFEEARAWYLRAAAMPGLGAWHEEQAQWCTYKAGMISGHVLGEWCRARDIVGAAPGASLYRHPELCTLDMEIAKAFGELDRALFAVWPCPTWPASRRGFRDLTIPARWRALLEP